MSVGLMNVQLLSYSGSLEWDQVCYSTMSILESSVKEDDFLKQLQIIYTPKI